MRFCFHAAEVPPSSNVTWEGLIYRWWCHVIVNLYMLFASVSCHMGMTDIEAVVSCDW